MSALRDDLGLVRYEPVSVRPENDWLRHRQALLAQVDALSGPIAIAAQSSDARDGAMAESAIDAVLRSLSEAALPVSRPEEEVRHAPT